MLAIKNKKLLAIAVSLLLGCACVKASADQQDPFETFNRASFNFNQKFDQVVLTPAAKTYRYVLPQPVRTGVTNFYNNINEIPSVANDLLQFHFLQATNDAWRFFLNSTAGIFGIFDIASQIGLPAHYTDFGLTLARWGCTNSPYLVLPLLGPGTVRDQIGIPVDYYLLSPYGYIYPRTTRALIVTGYVISWRANALDFQNLIAEASFDPYVFQKNAYLQRRNYLIQQTLAQKPFEVMNLNNTVSAATTAAAPAANNDATPTPSN